MTVPTPHVVGHRVYEAGAVDSRGNVIDSWADEVPLAVHGIAPGSMSEPGNGSRDLSLVVWSVIAPAGTAVGSKDLVVVGGREFRVDGEPRDWTLGPWDVSIAGVVIELIRAEG